MPRKQCGLRRAAMRSLSPACNKAQQRAKSAAGSGRNVMGRRLAVAAIAAALLASGGALAQSNFPTKPVHIYVPYPAGGGVDILTRTLGDVGSKQWGQPVVVDNRPGAGGVVASEGL